MGDNSLAVGHKISFSKTAPQLGEFLIGQISEFLLFQIEEKE